MKRENIKLLIFFVVTVLVGAGLHFLYEWSPNLLFAVLSPVRESVWEHLKLVFWLLRIAIRLAVWLVKKTFILIWKLIVLVFAILIGREVLPWNQPDK